MQITSVLFASESPMGCVVLEQNCLSGLPGEVAAEPSKANLRHFGERGVPWLSLHISIYKQRARRGLENVIADLQYQVCHLHMNSFHKILTQKC
jgi:hypothetical protein